MDLIEKAREFATKYYSEQFRHDGVTPYITHPATMADRLVFRDKITIACTWLHDILEDTKVTEDMLRIEFPEEVVNTVVLLTRISQETYFAFINRIASSGNNRAIDIKISDISHNMETLKEGSRKDKYRFAMVVLANASSRLIDGK